MSQPPPSPFVTGTPPRVTVECAALSNRGKVRPHNEDHYLVVRRVRSREVLATNLPKGTLPPVKEDAYVYSVADGMGGAAFGELASLLALQTGWDLGSADIKWTLKTSEAELAELEEKARLYFEHIDRAIAERVRLDPSKAGMGTTLTAVYTIANAGFVFHAGDSRAYLFRDGTLQRLTRDHTLAQDLADVGVTAARSFQHMLTSYVGAAKGELRVDVRQFELRDGDALLVCSDGLTDMVEESAIAATLARAPRPKAACKALVDLALEKGGRDNVTVLVGRYGVASRG